MKTIDKEFNDYLWNQIQLIQQVYGNAYEAGMNREKELDEMVEAHKEMEREMLQEDDERS